MRHAEAKDKKGKRRESEEAKMASLAFECETEHR